MTLRAYLARRVRFAAIFLWAAVFVLVLPTRDLPLPKSASNILVPLLGLGLMVAAWRAALAVRCPTCGVHYKMFSSAGFTSSKGSVRFNYCPGCGVDLDREFAQLK
jgi:hypothetical protein